MKLRAQLVLTFLSSLIPVSQAVAQTYGVTGSVGYGQLESNSVYKIDADGTTTHIATLDIVPNSFAYNDTNDVYYYGDHTGSKLYSYDVNLGVSSFVADLKDYGMPADKRLSGGADFFNGTYYYIPEQSVDSNDFYGVEFADDGKTMTDSKHFQLQMPDNWSGLGDFGDFAIDPASGILYASSGVTHTDNSFSAYLWSVDLNDPNLEVNIIHKIQGSAYQIAVDASTGGLHISQWGVNQYSEIDTSDGSLIGSVPVDGYFFDLATAGVNVQDVPEPSAASLLGLGGLALILRRRK